MGGGTPQGNESLICPMGLSPRGRGNLAALYGADGAKRSIPAWAGEPYVTATHTEVDVVYPRVGGGTIRYASGRRAIFGLSPRGRGNPYFATVYSRMGGSIPAWAGEPPRQSFRPCGREVYPRVGGGTAPTPTITSFLPGLSPRGRGNRTHSSVIPTYGRSIPAWAGEPDGRGSPGRGRRVYPRVGGGTPWAFYHLHLSYRLRLYIAKGSGHILLATGKPES